ncbi:hypothetical protein [Streptacidiphilus sp. PAMC 29251]
MDKLPGSNVTYHFGRNQPHGWIPYTDRQFHDLIADHVVANAPLKEKAAAVAWRSMVAAPNGTGGGLLPQ